jgi:hypothetical protein
MKACAVEPQHLAGGSNHATELEAGFAEAAAEVEHARAGPHLEPRHGDVAVPLAVAVAGEQMTEAKTLGSEDPVPALDELGVFLRRLDHRLSSLPHCRSM